MEDIAAEDLPTEEKEEMTEDEERFYDSDWCGWLGNLHHVEAILPCICRIYNNPMGCKISYEFDKFEPYKWDFMDFWFYKGVKIEGILRGNKGEESVEFYEGKNLYHNKIFQKFNEHFYRVLQGGLWSCKGTVLLETSTFSRPRSRVSRRIEF